MNNICTIICQKLCLMLHNSYPITYSYPYPSPYRCTMDEFSRKKKIFKARKDISAGYNLLGITIDSIYRTVAFDNSPESKKNQIYKVNEIGRYALYDRRTVFLVSRGSSLKDAANIANIIPFFRVINELRFFLLRWESKHANNRSEVRDKRVLRA